MGHACLLLESSQQIQLVKLLLKPKLIQIIFAKVELNCEKLNAVCELLLFELIASGTFSHLRHFRGFLGRNEFTIRQK